MTQHFLKHHYKAGQSRFLWILCTLLLVVEVVVVSAFLLGWVTLGALDIFLSCSRILLRFLLTCPPNFSATKRRSYKVRKSGSAVDSGDKRTKTAKLKQWTTMLTHPKCALSPIHFEFTLNISLGRALKYHFCCTKAINVYVYWFIS